MKNQIIQGDCLSVLKTLPSDSVDMVMTSPPYWALRDYGVPGQLGLEPTFQEYIAKLCDIFDEIRRVLKKEGTCWVNMGDTYFNSPTGKHTEFKGVISEQTFNAQMEHGKNIDYSKISLSTKCLLQIPNRFAIEMTNRGWILRNEIIWHKPNCMPSSIKDRFTVDFEKLFFFTKSKKYYFETQSEPLKTPFHGKDWETRKKEGDAMRAGTGKPYKCLGGSPDGRNKRTVWTIATKPYKETHFATYPEALCEIPIKAGCPMGGIVLDPFFGAGTTGLVAKKLGRNYLGIELNGDYIKIAEQRLTP